jgi:hypothetical protein
LVRVRDRVNGEAANRAIHHVARGLAARDVNVGDGHGLQRRGRRTFRRRLAGRERAPRAVDPHKRGDIAELLAGGHAIGAAARQIGLDRRRVGRDGDAVEGDLRAVRVERGEAGGEGDLRGEELARVRPLDAHGCVFRPIRIWFQIGGVSRSWRRRQREQRGRQDLSFHHEYSPALPEPELVPA